MVSADRSTDLIDLVSYTLDCNFIEAVKGICNEIGISYYYDFSEDIPESFKILRLISDMQQYDEVRDEKPIHPIDQAILNYYKPYVNDLFHKDGIDYRVQREFGIGYDEYSNRITIPIFSETGDLIGVKGRLFKEQLDENEVKYLCCIRTLFCVTLITDLSLPFSIIEYVTSVSLILFSYNLNMWIKSS